MKKPAGSPPALLARDTRSRPAYSFAFLAAPGRFLGGRLAPGLDALGDTGRLAAAIAQIIELGAPDLAAPHDFDQVDHRRIDRKNALDALAVGDLAHREILVEALPAARDADAFIGLHAGALAFGDLHVDDHRIAGLELRHFRAGQLGRVLGLDLSG